MSGEAPARPRVLVADDEEDVRNLVCRVLEESGYAVEPARDGAEAIEKFDLVQPQLVIVDLSMPGIDGWGVLRYVRKSPAPPPVVVLTARSEDEAFTKSVSSGAAGIVYKPFRFADLLATCEKALRVTAEAAQEVQPEERRRENRRILLITVKVLSREGTPIALGELVNISSSGAQVELGVRLEKGRLVFVAFKGGGLNMTFECRVQWTREVTGRTIGHGLQFLGVSPAQERSIRDLLSSAPSA